jgi:hypothetical protein
MGYQWQGGEGGWERWRQRVRNQMMRLEIISILLCFSLYLSIFREAGGRVVREAGCEAGGKG